MIEEVGVISACRDGKIWVSTQIKTTCGSCEQNNNCGTGTIAKAFASKQDELVLDCDQPAVIGQQVKLGIPENHLLSASLLVYLLPLIVMVLSVLAGQWLLPLLELTGELWLIAFTFACTALCFRLVAKHIGKDNKDRYQPKLLALLPADPNPDNNIPVTLM